MYNEPHGIYRPDPIILRPWEIVPSSALVPAGRLRHHRVPHVFGPRNDPANERGYLANVNNGPKLRVATIPGRRVRNRGVLPNYGLRDPGLGRGHLAGLNNSGWAAWQEHGEYGAEGIDRPLQPNTAPVLHGHHPKPPSQLLLAPPPPPPPPPPTPSATATPTPTIPPATPSATPTPTRAAPPPPTPTRAAPPPPTPTKPPATPTGTPPPSATPHPPSATPQPTPRPPESPGVDEQLVIWGKSHQGLLKGVGELLGKGKLYYYNSVTKTYREVKRGQILAYGQVFNYDGKSTVTDANGNVVNLYDPSTLIKDGSNTWFTPPPAKRSGGSRKNRKNKTKRRR